MRQKLFDAAGREFTRRAVVTYKLPDGSFGKAVVFSTHSAPARLDQATGPIRVGMAWRQWANYMGGEIVSIDSRLIGSIEDEIDKAEYLYRELHRDANTELP